MVATRSASGAAPGQRPRRTTARNVGRLAFALAPWVTLGFATPMTFIIAAWILRHRGTARAILLWISATVYTVALLVEVAHAGPGQSKLDDRIFAVCLLITMVVAGTQTIMMTRRCR